MSVGHALSNHQAKKWRSGSHGTPIFEISVLLDNIEKNYQLLQSKFTDAVTAQKKKAMWEAIAAKLNASRATLRSTSDIKKKWEDLKTRSKQKAVEVEKDMVVTDGRKRAKKDITELESRVMSLSG